MEDISIKTPSKINLFLKIKGKRPDGYHDIETVFLPLKDISDTITVSPSPKGIKIECEHYEVPCDSNNLCWKAAEAFSKEAGIQPDWNIRIEKRIPVAGGMGGGSSDAAAILKLLQSKHDVPDEAVFKIAKELGADIPFFLNPAASRAEGIGEELTALDFDLPEIPLVIAAPCFPISAAWAYKSLRQSTESCGIESTIEALREKDLKKLASSIHNDLAEAVWKKFPLIRLIKESLLELGALAAEVSGSGPSVFAVFKSQKLAEKARKNMEKEYGTLPCFTCLYK